ncbi:MULTISPECIES: alpha/beta fold hydrolase [unclassified Shewanella]|uniref:alpha/beta fold hydrolase n=1 Tax=unclassified Shewanella TaxID=196818 RepID=UPI0021DAF8F5|nr:MULTISPECIES: alpha/beta hydrolase [unclassified Shewanella]MCU8033524.1 alpha/beta hydrolase [Shewanella sp. SM71]MCU8082319.1 alpha/beta hydrolase [Shewanella sp. SM23]MCU8086341.1 alpha/beta hydrolase [Shewanella sp. SM21]MCU8095447.1 alpha/beta hydrolase [Shewanella sp. SM102]
MDFSSHRQQLVIADRKLSYLDVGSGPVLLFGHSYLWDSAMWAPQIATLSAQYRCIVPELWGHGQSDLLPNNSKTLLDIADQMLELMDALEITHFSVVGQSVGAMWGAELVLKAPTRVKTLVMLNSFIGFEPEVTRAKYDGMLDMISAAKAIPAPLISAISPLFFANDAENNTPELVTGFEQSLASITAEQIPTIVKLGRMIFGRRDTMEYAEQLTRPCLIMAGVEDKARSVLESYLMSDAIDGSQLVHIPAAGHISTLEQAEFINQHLADFLAKYY